jgi:hypothetical protein
MNILIRWICGECKLITHVDDTGLSSLSLRERVGGREKKAIQYSLILTFSQREKE